MKSFRVSENIVPVSEFKAQAAEMLRRLATSGEPVVITQNGKAAGVLLSPQAYDDLTERARFMAAVLGASRTPLAGSAASSRPPGKGRSCPSRAGRFSNSQERRSGRSFLRSIGASIASRKTESSS